MSEIRYEEESDFDTAHSRHNEGPGLPERLVKWGIAKDEAQAQYILLGLVVVFLVIAGYLFFRPVSHKGSTVQIQSVNQAQYVHSR